MCIRGVPDHSGTHRPLQAACRGHLNSPPATSSAYHRCALVRQTALQNRPLRYHCYFNPIQSSFRMKRYETAPQILAMCTSAHMDFTEKWTILAFPHIRSEEAHPWTYKSHMKVHMHAHSSGVKDKMAWALSYQSGAVPKLKSLCQTSSLTPGVKLFATL
jgi:hypothetical protein